ncbi:hypothetical protein B0H13DRAFT_2279843 [Mycena leptocephala]|nr:hypothetical protein B0H13DRAFT_2279843 [Mycena leptocephala]
MTMRTSVRISTRGKSLLSLVGFCYGHSAGRDTLLLLRDALYTGQKQLRNNVAATPMTPNRLNLNCTTLSYAKSNVIWVLDRHLAIQLLGMEKSGDYNDATSASIESRDQQRDSVFLPLLVGDGNNTVTWLMGDTPAKGLLTVERNFNMKFTVVAQSTTAANRLGTKPV